MNAGDNKTIVSRDKTPVSHVFANPIFIAAELMRGHTLYRALFHHEAKKLSIGGRILDIGGKTTNASYYRYLNRDHHSEVITTDLNPRPGVLALDVERPFPLEDASFDFVLAFNLFEHVFSYESAPKEVHRILKPSGRFVICVPFLHEYHADPHDYFRFTAPALLRIWESAGMKCTLMCALGEGLLSYALTKTASLVLPKALYNFVAPLVYLISMPFDRLVALRPRLDGLTMPARFPMGYYAIFEKV